MGEQAGKIIDFEAASRVRMLERVRSLTMARDALIETARLNHVSQAQIHAASLSLLDVGNWKELDTRFRGAVRASLCMDYVGLLVEGANLAEPFATIRPQGRGFTDAMMQGQQVWMGPVSEEAISIYGKRADGTRSQALMRLQFGALDAVLVFASKDRAAFSSGQGSELIAYFAKVIEHMVHRFESV